MVPFRFSHRTLALVVGAVAAGYLALAFQLPDFTAVEVPVQPATLPRWLGAVLLLLAVLLFFQKQEAAAEGAESDEGEGTRLGRIADPRWELALFAGSAAVYIALITPLGFLIATTAYTAATAWYLGFRRHIVNGLVSFGVAALLYVGMSEGLNVVLPQGPLPF